MIWELECIDPYFGEEPYDPYDPFWVPDEDTRPEEYGAPYDYYED